MQHAIILGLLVLGPPPANATVEPVAPLVLAQSGGTDLLMHPSRETEGAARLGGTEIVNPPHESFGMMQKPTNPSAGDATAGRRRRGERAGGRCPGGDLVGRDQPGRGRGAADRPVCGPVDRAGDP